MNEMERNAMTCEHDHDENDDAIHMRDQKISARQRHHHHHRW